MADTDADILDLARRLMDRTRAGAVAWEARPPQPDDWPQTISFVARLSSGCVAIRDDRGDGECPYVMTIMRADDMVVEATQTDTEGGREPDSELDYTLRDLHVLARRA